MRIGLEGISFSVPQSYIEMNALAKARNVDPLKYIKGLGQVEMSVASPCEDTVVLAAEAAASLLANFNIDKSSIGLVIVGTESSVDQSKPVAVFVHHLLGLPQACRTFEVKHACYGAMAGLNMAINWIQSGRAPGKKALIIASDIARYGAGTAGEPTQGAGSVAMLVSDSPTLIEFNLKGEGVYSKQVMDFWRPNYSKEAFADGHFSINCYLDALVGAYESYTKSTGDKSKNLAACLYHVPFVKMAHKAHLRLLEFERGAPFEKDSPALKEAQDDYAKRVSPHLDINAKVGNIYTGSLFLALLKLVEDFDPKASNRDISLFSYGSGCTAEWMTAKVLPEAHLRMKKHPYQKVLEGRVRLTVEQYERMLEGAGKADQNDSNICNPATWGIKKNFLYLGTHNNVRNYAVDGEVIIRAEVPKSEAA